MPDISTSFHRALTLSIVALGLSGCDALTSPKAAKGVSFSVSTSEKAPSSLVSSARVVAVGGSAANAVTSSIVNGSMVIASGTDTLVIDSIRVVLAQIVLRQLQDTTCGNAGHDDKGDATCAPIASGPYLATLPLTAGAASLFDGITIPNGTYTGIRVRIHNPKIGDSTAATTTFLAAHPEWSGKSMMVDGKFNGVAYHWAHDPPVQLEHAFNPPIVVDANTAFNFTLQIDVAKWFVASNGALINPGAPGNALYPQVAGNVSNSFHVFKDDKKNGHNDGP
ncbi:MAG TPA: hypothetical protein VF483_00820 [Gemmatimonadaceae bacterium]